MKFRSDYRDIKVFISRKWLVTGILLSMLMSIGFYGFAVAFREAFRLVGFHMYGDILILSPNQVFFYNMISASLASVLSFSFGLTFVIQNSVDRSRPKLLLRQRSVLNDHNFYTWNTFDWIAKIFMMLGIWYMSFPMQYEIDIYKDYKYWLMLFVIVWYLNIWLTLTRSLGRRTYKWIGIVAGAIIINSFLLTRLSLINYDKLNNYMLRHTDQYYYQLEYPETQILMKTGQSHLAIDLSVGFSKMHPENGPAIFDYNRTDMTLDEIPKFITHEKQQIDQYELQYVAVFLQMDKSVPMYFVEMVKQKLRESGISTIYYSTIPKGTNYPNNYSGYKNLGIKENLGEDCSKVIRQVDSLKNLGYKASQVRFPNTPCYRMADFIRGMNRVLVGIDSHGIIKLNNRLVSKERLGRIIYSFFKQYKDNAVVLLKPEDSCLYGYYITTKDLIMNEILKIRKEEAGKRFSLQYNFDLAEWDKGNGIEEIEEEYPFNILDFTKADEALYQYEKESK